MKIKKIQLKKFKRFDDLTIDLGGDPAKIIALVGPNGCGKSSVFDAFELVTQRYKGSNYGKEPVSYYDKSIYDDTEPKTDFNHDQAIKIIRDDGTSNFVRDSFYLRSPYRFTPELNVAELKKVDDVLQDKKRPKSMSFLDSRLQENYERLLGMMYEEFNKENGCNGTEARNKFIGKLNDILSNILDIKVSDMGNVLDNRGQLYFKKGNSRNFPYKNLSSGEKEVIDIILDLIVKVGHYKNTVFAIDEPELHLNTAIQRKLLVEIEKLIPDTCQLWVATHSIGFLRALQEDLKCKSQILDFSERDYFVGCQVIKPISGARKDWQRIFKTALEDLTGLIAPGTIIYCEGKLKNSIDEAVFNKIFEAEFPDALFISATNKSESVKYAGVALTILNRAFDGVKIKVIVDGDNKDQIQVPAHGSVEVSMLVRREFENYLFDKEILKKYADSKDIIFDERKYDDCVGDIVRDDVKSIANSIFSESLSRSYHKRTLLELAEVVPQTSIYSSLRQEIFGLTSN